MRAQVEAIVEPGGRADDGWMEAVALLSTHSPIVLISAIYLVSTFRMLILERQSKPVDCSTIDSFR